MARLYNKKFSRAELLKQVGDISQVGGVRSYELTDGNQKGVRAVDVRTGTGFRFTVLPGRGMDISMAEYNGIPLNWRSSTGEVHAAYYEPEGSGWLRSFYGGLLHTCGLSNVGEPCQEGDKPTESVHRQFGIHGRIGNIPAQNVYADAEWQGDDYLMWVRGKVRETAALEENLCLTRKISTKLGERRFLLHDVVENLGYAKTEFMILYHMNMGFPLISEDTQLILPVKKTKPRDKEAAKGIKSYAQCLAPQPDYKEQVFYHTPKPAKDGRVTLGVVNHKLSLGLYIRYPVKELPNLVQWKMMGEGSYVVGIEPANCQVEGRAVERKQGTLQFLAPGEKKEFHLEIGVVTSADEIAQLEKGK